MKPIEEAFNSNAFRRVVLPGIVMTIGVHPVLAGVFDRWIKLYGFSESLVVLGAEIIFWGLLLSSTTNWVYYVYEGFQLLWLTAMPRRWNERRLAALNKAYNGFVAERAKRTLSPREEEEASLVYEKLLDYPLQWLSDEVSAPKRYVDRSTLLGNIITCYELYPKTRYRIDGVYYWHHLLALAPDNVRAEFNEKYAFAESLVLTSFAGGTAAAFNGVVMLGLAIGTLSGVVVAEVPVGGSQAAALTTFGLSIFVIFYLLAISAHREVAAIFRSVVDLSIGKLERWSKNVAAPLSPEAEKRIDTVKRYLDALLSK